MNQLSAFIHIKKSVFALVVLLCGFLLGEGISSAQVFPPMISTPVPGSTVTTTSVTFTGDHTSQDLEHWLYVGTSVGAKDLHNSGSMGTAHDRFVSGLPSSGTIFVRYWTRNSGGWSRQDHTYTMNTGGGATFPPAISVPTPGLTVTTTSVTFTGGHTAEDLEHWLYVGTSLGGKGLHNSGSMGTGHTRAVSGLPTSGTIYVRWWSRNSSGWQSQDHTYTMNVAGGGSVTISPPSAALSPGEQQDFDGSGGTPAYAFVVQGDTTGGASVDFLTGLYTAGPNSGTTIVHMADSGNPELSTDALVTVTGGGATFPPAISVPTPGSTVTTTSVTFTGGHTSQDLEHWLYVGTSVGAKDLHNSLSMGTAHDRVVSGLPSSGTIFVRYWSRNSSGWQAQDHTYGMNVAGGNVGVISQSGWTVHFVSSQQAANPAQNAFDGLTTTKWNSQSGTFPHDLQINLGSVYEMEGFRVIARTPIESHAISFFEFFVSNDGVSWGDPVASGELSKDFAEMEVQFPRQAGQYIRLRPLGWHDGRSSVAIGELNVLGASFSGNFAPNGSIDSPTSNLTINAGQDVLFSGTYFDEDGDSPLSFLWDFSDSAISGSTVEDPGLITFNNPGTYTVTFTVTDEFGLSDTVPGSVVVKVLSGANSVIPRGDWTVEFVNSEEVVLSSQVAVNVFDGNTNTIWHTQYNDVGRPHEIQFNLGAAYALDGLRYLPRQSGVNGRIEEYHIYVSPDGRNWGTPVARGKFTNNATEQRVQFSPKIGQFIRLVAITEINGNQWASMAEANVEGVCKEPFVRIINPLTDEVQVRPNLTVTASVCLTLASHAGWKVRFSVDNGAQQQTMTLPGDGIIHPNTFQATFAGLSGDNHKVEAFILDNNNNVVSGSSTFDVVTHIGLGDVHSAIGDSITVGLGDDVNSDGTSLDGRNTDTGIGFTPILNNLLTAPIPMGQGYPHNIHNDGISGDSSAGVLVRAPKILKNRKKATAFLIGVGTNDANSGLVPSGKGQNPPGAGTFKDNLQKIIDVLHNPAQGREVYLAKVPWTTNGASISTIQDYNIAIDELVAFNSLTVTPPDFFVHFQSNPSHLASDGIHPNGLGYKSMAVLWCKAIIPGGTCPNP